MDFLLFKDLLNGLVHHIFCQWSYQIHPLQQPRRLSRSIAWLQSIYIFVKICHSFLVEPCWVFVYVVFSGKFDEVDVTPWRLSLQAFHPFEDELTRRLSTVELVTGRSWMISRWPSSLSSTLPKCRHFGKKWKSKYSRDWGLKTGLTLLKAPLFGEETLDAKVTQLLNTFDMCGHDLWRSGSINHLVRFCTCPILSQGPKDKHGWLRTKAKPNVNYVYLGPILFVVVRCQHVPIHALRSKLG